MTGKTARLPWTSGGPTRAPARSVSRVRWGDVSRSAWAGSAAHTNNNKARISRFRIATSHCVDPSGGPVSRPSQDPEKSSPRLVQTDPRREDSPPRSQKPAHPNPLGRTRGETLPVLQTNGTERAEIPGAGVNLRTEHRQEPLETPHGACVQFRRWRRVVVCWRRMNLLATQRGVETQAPRGCPGLLGEATDAIFTQPPGPSPRP